MFINDVTASSSFGGLTFAFRGRVTRPHRPFKAMAARAEWLAKPPFFLGVHVNRKLALVVHPQLPPLAGMVYR